METSIQDYYSVGSKDNIVVSSSSLKHIDPEQGGSPIAFIEFLENKGDDTPSTRLGTLIHLYHEDPNNFAIADVLKPSEKLGIIADFVIDRIKEGVIYSTALIQEGIEFAGYYSNRWGKMDKLIDDVVQSIDAYVQEIITAKENNQVFITKTQLEPITNAIDALNRHPVASKLMLAKDCDITGDIVLTEVERFGVYQFTDVINDEEKTYQLNYKAKIDKVIINLEKKVVKIVDLKTTGKGAYFYSESNFKTYKTYRQLAFYYKAIKDMLRENYNVDPSTFKFEFYITVVETNGTGQCVVYRLNKRWIDAGLEENSKLLKRIGQHQETSNWSYSLEELEPNYMYIIPLRYVEENN